ncbi:MAG: IclR family transcriptional regulator [Terriglobia bacterium]
MKDRTRSQAAVAQLAVAVPDEGSVGASALKPFAFLEAIGRAQRPLSISELSSALNVPQPTTHRIVHMLESGGLLEREPGGRRYAPGVRLVRLGFGLVAASVRTASRRTILERLSNDLGETCNFGVVVGNYLMYVDRVEAAWPFGLRFEPGSRVPLHCTAMGKLLLSFLSPEQRRQVLNAGPLQRYTDHTTTDPLVLEKELERIRQSEISADNQEFLTGVVCVAVPVRTREGTVIASLAVSAPLARVSMSRAMQDVPRLRAAAQQMSDSLGDARDSGACGSSR